MAMLTARTMVAGGVAGLGLAIGGLAVATADDTETPAPPESSQGQPDGDRGPGGHHGPAWAGELAASLAEELGVTEDEVRDAWEAVRDDVRPDRPDRGDREDGFEPPSDADLEALQAKVAAALADELDLPQAEVEAALEKVRGEAEQQFEDRAEEWRAEARERLVERLDQAVEDGDLTEADRTSVLKAFDAGVLGGGHGGGFGFGRGPR